MIAAEEDDDDDDGLERVVACDLCGGSDFAPRLTYREQLLFTGETFSVVTCRGCDLSFLDPRPRPEVIGRYYQAAYPPHHRPPPRIRPWYRLAASAGTTRQGLATRAALAILQYMSWFWIPPRVEGGAVLDLGCSTGNFLSVMGGLGWRTFGVEADPAAAARAEEAGHEVTVGAGDRVDFAPGSFDLVYAWHALEHMHSPRTVLERCFAWLRPGGRLALAVPHFDGLQRRLFGPFWCGSEAPRHLFHFTRRSLTAYVERAGFRAIQVRTRTGAGSVVQAGRHFLNHTFHTRIGDDPPWLVDLAEVLALASLPLQVFGRGNELRVVCEKPA